MNIPFNIPYLTGKEIYYIQEVMRLRKFSGDGAFTKQCQNLFEESYNFKKALLTPSCTDALEMCAILANISKGDEVILPSYTFVSTANPFLMRGAKLVFADSEHKTPNLDITKIKTPITPKTKAIVPAHYAGMACDMGSIMKNANKQPLK